MKAATPVEKENSTQQEQKKKQKRVEALTQPLSDVEIANSQTQKPEGQNTKNASVNQNSNRLINNNGIPAVHGSQTIYDQGATLMYEKLQTSLEQTGDINHPDTKKSEMDYKMTLGIKELRDYQDIKSGTYAPKTTEEQTVVNKSSQEIPETSKLKTTNETPKKADVISLEQPKPNADKTEEVVNDEVKTPENAKDNPGFLELQGQISSTAKSQKHHEPSGKSAQDAQAAAVSPSNERESKAQASQVNVMNEQKPGVFSAVEFKAQLKDKISKIKLPENEEAADDFEKNNNIQEVNQKAMGDVKNEKNAASGDIASATDAKPNTAAQPVRNAAKMPTQNPGKAPAVVSVAKAMPTKRGTASVEQPIQQQTNSIDEQMKENDVTDNMLANSNESSFTSALDEKNKAKNDSKEATNQFRNNEDKKLSKTQKEAQNKAAQQITGMHDARKGGLDKVHGNQGQTATKDSAKRKEIADHINRLYIASKTEVNTILNNLDKTVAYKFETGTKAAKAAFEKHVEDNMTAYKKKRYGGSWFSWKNLRRVGDAIAGLPKEVNQFFVTGKEVYIKTMDYYITDIANHVAAQLNAAKGKISEGKKAVQDYVNSLSPSLRKIGKDAITEIQNKFNALEETVNSKKDALIDVLAQKYAENVASIDARIKELKEQNSGLINKALKALSGIFAFIIQIKNTLVSLLTGLISVVKAIITDPIGFFKNLIEGIGQGFTNFATNIWTHLKTGFFGWLTGATKGISLTMPEDVFSIKGIFSISMQVLGLGWEAIRSIGSKVVGEPIMKVLETGVEVVQVVRKDGVAGLWEYLKDQFADLKETVMDAIMDIIQTQVIQAGIKWVLGLLSPVGAFVKAVMAIIDVVKFFIQRAAQIAELVKAFIDSITAIASGKVGAVAKSIENALGKAIPVLIGLLAAVLGISGLADKVLGVIRKIRKRIEAGIIKFWNFVKAKGGKLLSKVGVGKKDKKEKKVDDKRTTAQKQKDLDAGIKEGTSYLKQNKRLKKEDIDDKLDNISTKHQLVELKLVVDKHEETGEDLVHVHGKVNPEKDGEKVKINVEDVTSLKAKDIPVKKNDLIKAKYIKGKFLADVKEINDPKGKDKEGLVEYQFRYTGLNKSIEKDTFKQFLDKWKKGDIEKVNEERKYLIENRPSYRTGLIDEVWENAMINGKVFDPNIRPRKELFWDKSKNRFDQWHMGHKQGHKYSDLVDAYMDGRKSWEEFISEYNNEKNYLPEDPKSNMSHEYE